MGAAACTAATVPIRPGGITITASEHQIEQLENLSTQTLRKGITFLFGTCVIATIGYMLAGWDWVDAIYMVTITIFGVGYGEVHPVETLPLRLFTIGVIFAGCSSLIYVIGGVFQKLNEGEIERMLGVRNRSREIDQLRDHTIICGYGRVGQMLAAELSNRDQPIVILDHAQDRVEQAIADGFLAIQGDAVDDDVLHRVGLLHAKTIATVLPDDATNVFITLTARDLCDSVKIIARAESPCTERKLLLGGASNVVMPAAIGAIRIAQLATAKQEEDANLPENRFRMLHAQARRDNSSDSEQEIVQSAQSELDDLANLASNLTRSVAERHHDQLTSKED